MIAGSVSEKTPKINLGVNSILGEVSISAPEGTKFSLETIDGKRINLSDYKGKKVVLFFYPLDQEIVYLLYPHKLTLF